MSLKLHLCLLILVSILLLLIVSTLSATDDTTKPVLFVYAQSAVTPDPPSSTAPEALPAIWRASGD